MFEATFGEIGNIPSYLKLIPLQLVVISAYRTLTPPGTSAGQQEQDAFQSSSAATETLPGFLIHGGTLLKESNHAKFVYRLLTSFVIVQGILYTWAVAESALVLVATFPTLSRILPEPLAGSALLAGQRLSLTMPFVIGQFLMCAGCAIRVACYRRLGAYFTFELSLRDEHKLITSGPYSVVRHPAYTGSLLFIAGTYIAVRDRGSLLAALGLWETSWGKAVRFGLTVMAVLGTFSFVDRTRVEDEALKRRFGQQWIDWSRKTRYKLVPFLL